jgi:hypothetical protein
MDMIRVFISYRHADSSLQTGRLYDHLVASFGAYNVFKDNNSISPGRDFRAILSEQVESCDVFLAVIGDDWLSAVDESGARRLDDPGDYVRIEVEAALRRDVPLIPVLVGRASVPTAVSLPESLRELAYKQASTIRPDPDFRTDVGRLIQAIQSVASGTSRRSVPPSWPTDPWSATGPSRVASTPLPEQFGRYKLLWRLGQSGQGSVFLAEDILIGRRVALRVPDFGPEDLRDARIRYLERARRASTLRHPNLCPIIDVGEINQHPYLAMEFIEGKSLDQTIPASGLAGRQVAAMVGKLAHFLHEAHKSNVIHGDLKASNVVFPSASRRRSPVIVGFGRPGVEPVAPAQDIHALGQILAVLLTGRPSDDGPGQPAASAGASPPRSTPEPALEAIVRRATDGAIDGGYSSMIEFSEALASYLRFPTVNPSAVGPSPPHRGDSPADFVFDEIH